jgi:hypothetical protein
MVAGIVFVTLAAANVVVMLEAFQPSRSATARTRLIAVHRVGGYLFVSVLCIMTYSMSQRLVGVGDNRSSACAPGSTHCACTRPRALAFIENSDRTPLQA